MRKPIVAGNWKMNKTVAEAQALVADVQRALTDAPDVEVVFCPPFTALAAVGAAVRGTSFHVGGQNLHWETSGAFTGEISASMLIELGCTHVIVGHSERRQYFGETDQTVNRRARAALAAGLTPIVCVGETLPEHDAGQTLAVVERQVRGGLEGLAADDVARLVVAYEPVWAIGTGKTATTTQAQDVHAAIRQLLRSLHGAAADAVRIQYGGSVKPSNARELFSQPDIDGGLVGGASLDAQSFVEIIRGAR